MGLSEGASAAPPFSPVTTGLTVVGVVALGVLAIMLPAGRALRSRPADAIGMWE